MNEIPARKILIAALCGIGDFLMFLPTLRLLRAWYPKAQIDILIFPNGTESLLKNLPLIDRVVLFPLRKYHFVNLSKWEKIKDIAAVVRHAWLLRTEQYDICLWPFAFTTFKKQFLAFLIGAKKTVMHRGVRKTGSRSLFPGLNLIAFDRYANDVQRNLDLLKPFGVPVSFVDSTLPLGPPERAHAQTYFPEKKEANQIYLGWQPGGGKMPGAHDRQWPLRYFIHLANQLGESYSVRNFLFGTKQEEELLSTMAAQINHPCRVITSLSLTEVAAILERMDLFIGNDSSLPHLAASVGTKTLVVIGPTNPWGTGPWGSASFLIRAALPCSPCFDRDFFPRCPHRCCYAYLSVEDVFRFAKGIIEQAEKGNAAGHPVIRSIEMDPSLIPEMTAEFIQMRERAGR